MKKVIIKNNTTLIVNDSVEGIAIESKCERITTMKEPITDGAPLIYTERKDGVLPAYDIRTDRWEVAIDAMDKIDKSITAQRDAKLKESTKKDVINEPTVEPIPATN